MDAIFGLIVSFIICTPTTNFFFEIPQCAKHVIFISKFDNFGNTYYIPYFPTQLYCCSFILLLCSSSKSKKMIVPTFCITVERIKHGPLSEAKQVIVMAFKLVKTFHGPSLDQVSISMYHETILTVAPKLKKILLKDTHDIVKSMLFLKTLKFELKKRIFLAEICCGILNIARGPEP